MEKEEQVCENCKFFKDFKTGSGICNNPNKPHYYDHIEAKWYCFAHELKTKNKRK